MVREGAPTTSLFVSAKDMDADRSLRPGLDLGIGMTGSAGGESDSTATGIMVTFRAPPPASPARMPANTASPSMTGVSYQAGGILTGNPTVTA
jgi:hypothetical protein